MKKVLTVLFVVGMFLNLTGCGVMEDGSQGVRTSWTGKINHSEVEQGFYTAAISSVKKFTVKENLVELNDLHSKASDNLSLQDLDVAIYYRVLGGKLSELELKYSGMSPYNGRIGLYMPMFSLVEKFGADVTGRAVATITSLEMHKNRDQLKSLIKENLQKTFDESDPNSFLITKVAINNIVTDPSIEESIKKVIDKEKELEAKGIEEDIVKKQAAINEALSASLTPAIIRQRELDVIEKVCGGDNRSDTNCILSMGGNAPSLILGK